MRAFLLVQKQSIRWSNGEPAGKPEIKGVMCVVLAESAQEVAKIINGEYGLIQFDEAPRPIIRLPRELFFPHPLSEKLLQYKEGPIDLCIRENGAGTYLFIIEAPLLEPDRVAV